jgi:transcriptional regulator with XRE-family HTH domain
MKIAQNLSYLMTVHELKNATLAKRTGLTPPTIHKLLQGTIESPSASTVSTLASFFNITMEELMHTDLSKQIIDKSYVSQFPLAPIIAWENIDRFIHGELIEILGKVPAHCSVGDKAFALTIDSSIYAPVFQKGSIIGIDPDAKIKHGNYVIVLSHETKKVVFKQMLMDEDGIIYFGNITQDGKKIAKTDDDVIIGRVAFLSHDF